MYDEFAEVYDLFMRDIPYDDWTALLMRIFAEHGLHSGIVLDVGCGTGALTRRMSARYDMIGVDVSPEMLMEAQRAWDTQDKEILYLCQDMREIDLYGTVAGAYCMCDSINYMTDFDDLIRVLDRVRLFLETDGIFVFDMRTLYFYEAILADRTFFDTADEADIVWENFFDKETHIHTYDLTIYRQSPEVQPCYRRFTETHTQRGYSVEEVTEAITRAGLELVDVCDELDGGAPGAETERMLYITRCTDPGKERTGQTEEKR